MTESYRQASERRPLFLGTNNHVACIEQTTGETLWQTKLPHASAMYQGLVTLLLHRHRLFAGAAKCAALLEPDSGEILWATKLKKFLPPAALALDEGVPGGLLIAAGAGRMFGLDAGSGSLAWRNDLPGLGYLPVTIRAPNAVVAQPRPFYVQAGKAKVLSQVENDQDLQVGTLAEEQDNDPSQM